MDNIANKVLDIVYFVSESKSRKIGVVLLSTASLLAIRKLMNLSSGVKVDITNNKNINNKSKVHVDKQFFKNLIRLLKVCIPKVLGREVFSLVILTFSMAARTLLSISFSEITSQIVKSIVKNDLTEFLINIIILGALSLPGSFINSLLEYLNKKLAIYLRENLANFYQSRLLEDMCYYKITNLDSRIKNPDQIFSSDIDKFATTLSNLYSNFTKPLFDIIFFSLKLKNSMGWEGPGYLALWYLISGVLMKFITPSFGKLTAIEQTLEGKFRANHKKILVHSEEIAFYNGNEWENLKLAETFKYLTKHINSVFIKRFFMGIFDAMLVRFGATIVGTILLGLPVFTGKFKRYEQKNKNQNAAEITKDYIQNSSLLINLAKAIGKIIVSYKDIQNLAGYTYLVNQLSDVIIDVKKKEFHKKQINSSLSDKYTGGIINQADYIEFNDIPIITPNGESLSEHINFKILPGQHTFISGPNGCGKSSLFRILGGLWPIRGGELKRPSFYDIFYIPQKPYLPKGNLRDQIIYPHSYEEFVNKNGNDEYLEKLMEMVSVSHVLSKHNGFETVKEWKDVLSGGEKQRVAMARLYYHKPKYAILDECTSAVSVDIEDKMYNQAKKLGITLITVSHRNTLCKFHDYIVRFKENSISFEKMDLDEINN